MPWAKRLRYLILDEAHGITDRDSGSVWEHILVLTQCPFLALSATIGNVDNFLGWLRSIKTRPVELVQHAERSTYQRISIYDHERKSLPEINAVTLATSQNLKAGLTAEWRMLPHQTLALYTTLARAFEVTLAVDDLTTFLATLCVVERYAILASMCLACNGGSLPPTSALVRQLFDTTKDNMEEGKLAALLESPQVGSVRPSHLVVLAHMSPESFFAGQAEIAKNDVALYDNLLRRVCEAARSDNRLLATFHQLNQPLMQAASKIDDSVFVKRIYPLVTTLRAGGLLPAIVFLFDRHMCDALCKALASHLSPPQRQDEEVHYLSFSSKTKSFLDSSLSRSASGHL